MTVADRIKQRRKELNLSQEELAKKIGKKDKSSISKIEKSGNDISMKNIRKIAQALGVSSQYLLGWEELSKELRVEILANEFELAQAKSDGNKELMKELEEKGDYLSAKFAKKYDMYLSSKYDNQDIFVNDDSKQDNITKKALEMYNLYEKADPRIKAAVESLLKGPQ